jgi:hypothetical protein
MEIPKTPAVSQHPVAEQQERKKEIEKIREENRKVKKTEPADSDEGKGKNIDKYA